MHCHTSDSTYFVFEIFIIWRCLIFSFVFCPNSCHSPPAAQSPLILLKASRVMQKKKKKKLLPNQFIVLQMSPTPLLGSQKKYRSEKVNNTKICFWFPSKPTKPFTCSHNAFWITVKTQRVKGAQERKMYRKMLYFYSHGYLEPSC